jgi:hypothetical protein
MIVNRLIEKAMTRAQGAQASLGRSESESISFENDKLTPRTYTTSTGWWKEPWRQPNSGVRHISTFLGRKKGQM